MVCEEFWWVPDEKRGISIVINRTPIKYKGSDENRVCDNKLSPMDPPIMIISTPYPDERFIITLYNNPQLFHEPNFDPLYSQTPKIKGQVRTYNFTFKIKKMFN